MTKLCTLLLLFLCVKIVLPQGVGSGSNGNLRLCVVEKRGSYKRAGRFCPILDEENSGIECVLGTDRLDCLRRMSKGTVDFGVFSPEELVAAQWANLDVYVTNELKLRPRQFEHSIVAVVNRRILPETSSSLHSVLKGTTLCQPRAGGEDLRPLSDTLAQYLESLVTEKSCNISMSLTENRIQATAKFFGKACKAGPWVPDRDRDIELKHRYQSLCAACDSPKCSVGDRYWGPTGALTCLAEGAGDVTWAVADDVTAYFGTNPGTIQQASPENFAYLCRDGSSQPLNTSEPCVWINRPWPVIVSKSKVVEQITKLTSSLTNSSVTVEGHWRGALIALLDINQALSEPLLPARTPLDFLGTASGFREAYSQSGCEPPRHVTHCTISLLEKNKCDWMAEAGSVYGIAPPLQCIMRNTKMECLEAIKNGDADVTVGDTDLLVTAVRDYSLSPILHEVTPIVEQMNTVVAYVKTDVMMKNIADLRGKRAAFPRYDGVAWHSVLRYLKTEVNMTCHEIKDYFSEICAPGVEKTNVSLDVVEKLTKNCYKEDETLLEGDVQALRSLVEGKSDVAFISMSTYNMYKAKQIQEPWTKEIQKIVPVCPEKSKKYCYISWSNIGHIFALNNLTAVRRQEMINIFTKLDQLFGKYYHSTSFRSPTFSMYGPFNHKYNVLFHNNTRNLVSDTTLRMHPYDKLALNFERGFINSTFESCQLSNFMKDSGVKSSPTLFLLLVSFLACLKLNSS